MDLSRLGLLSGQTNSGDQRADDLLTKIKDLLQQYLALGGDTPVAGEAQQLSDAIDANMGGTSTGMDTGGSPPLGAPAKTPVAPEGSPQEEAPETPAVEQREPPDEVGGYQGGGMAGARAGAAAFLKKQNKKGQGKAA